MFYKNKENLLYRMVPYLSIFLIFLVASCIITFPAILHINKQVIGGPGLRGELFLQSNILYNIKKGNFTNWFITDLVNYPKGENLGRDIAHSLQLFFSVPLGIFLSPGLTYNLLVILTFTLNGFMMYLLSRDFFPSKLIAFSSSFFFMFNSYTLSYANMGSLHKITLFFLPLYFLCLFRLLKAGKNIYIFGSSVFLLLIYLTYPIYAYYVILFTVMLVVYDLINTKGSTTFFKKIFLVAVLSAMAILFYDYIIGIKDFSYTYKLFSKYKPPFNYDEQVSADIFHPFRFYLTHLKDFPVGFSLLGVGLGIFSIIKKRGFCRFLFITAVIFIIIAAGPYIMFNEKPLEILGQKIILPYYFLYNYGPNVYGRWLVFPIRAFPIINICFALLIGFALTLLAKKLAHKRYILVTLLFIFSYILETFVIFPDLLPLRLSKLNLPDFYTKIKTEKFEALLNLPVIVNDKKMSKLYVYYAAMSNKKMMNSFRSDKLSFPFPTPLDSIVIKRKFISELSKWDVRYIVIHNKLFEDASSLEAFLKDIAWLDPLCGVPKYYEEDGLIVYRIPVYNNQ